MLIPIFLLYLQPIMRRLTKLINRTLSIRLSLMVVCAMALLLMASLAVMLHFSRKAVKYEAIHKASQTLDGTVERVDNMLLSVEQATGNIYIAMLRHKGGPEMMFTYASKLVESNPCLVGCAIAFKENYFPGHKLFLTYVHYADSADVAYGSKKLVRDDSFGDRPYTQQEWFTLPMERGISGWLNPLIGLNTDEAPIFTYSLPIPGPDGKPVGVIGVDVSLTVLSHIVAEAKPSANSYSTLLAKDGSYIVHPDTNKLNHKTVFELYENADPSVREVAFAMVSGQTGYRPFRMDGTDYYVFYKPFERSILPGRTTEKLGWSAGIVYPEDDIFGDYNSLFHYVLVIAIACLLLMFLLSWAVIHHQLKPLDILAKKAQKIAKGNYDEPIPDCSNKDEIGQLQGNFKHMQQSLSKHIGELERLTTMMREHGDELRVAYEHAQKADRMKMAFLHNMTNQMLAPAEAINRDVETLCDIGQDASGYLVGNIQRNGNTIAELLKNLLNISDEDKIKEISEAETGKEVKHD